MNNNPLDFEEKNCGICGRIINISKLQLFCGSECTKEYLMNNNLLKKQLDDDEEEQIDIEMEKEASWHKGHEEGYLKGYLDAEKVLALCPVCRVTKVESIHHIIPRSNGGITTIDNIIGLCNKCHDEIEMKTDDILKERPNISSRELKRFILNGFPSKINVNIVKQ